MQPICLPIILLPALIIGGLIGLSLRLELNEEPRDAQQIKRVKRRYHLSAFLIVYFVIIGFVVNTPLVYMQVVNAEFCEDRWYIDCSDILDTVDTSLRLLLPPLMRPHICFVADQPICESNSTLFMSYLTRGSDDLRLIFSWDYYLLTIVGGLLASFTCYLVSRNHYQQKKKKRDSL